MLNITIYSNFLVKCTNIVDQFEKNVFLRKVIIYSNEALQKSSLPIIIWIFPYLNLKDFMRVGYKFVVRKYGFMKSLFFRNSP